MSEINDNIAFKNFSNYINTYGSDFSKFNIEFLWNNLPESEKTKYESKKIRKEKNIKPTEEEFNSELVTFVKEKRKELQKNNPSLDCQEIMMKIKQIREKMV
jgi:hypothetical protein